MASPAPAATRAAQPTFLRRSPIPMPWNAELSFYLLVERGMLVQLTAASLDGRLGPGAQKTARRLLELGLAHLLASDAHAPDLRQIGMSAAARAVGDEDLARWLTEDVPAAIVAGGEIPPRPARHARGFRRPSFRRES